MSKPTKYPQWATTGSIIEPSAAKKSAGHLSGEQPIPQYENWRENLVDQWIEYFDGLNTTGAWRWFLPLGRAAAESNITWTDNTMATVGAGGAGVLNSIPVHLEVGSTIKAIGARVLGTGAGLNVEVHLYKNGGSGSFSTSATLTITTPPASWATYTQTLNEVVADQTGYTFEVEMPTTGQAIALVGIQVVPPV